MSTATLARPGRRPGALVPVGFDPRPCVVNPAEWWDTGNDGNAAAMWLCRKRCPVNDDTCQPSVGSIRRGIPYVGTYKPQEAKVCDDCKHPRVRNSSRGPVVCKCPNSGLTREQIVQAWLAASGETRTIAEIAPEIGLDYEALKGALQRARKAGDRRVPLMPSGNTRQVAA